MADAIRTTRRAFIGGLAAVAPVAATTAGAAAPNLQELLDRHRAVIRQFNDICDFEDSVKDDDPRYSGLKAELVRLDEAEERALDDVCAMPVQTLADARTKAEYLIAHLKRAELTDGQHLLFIESFLAV